jgi:hypothetical protein
LIPLRAVFHFKPDLTVVLFSTIGQFEKYWAKSKSPYQQRDCLNIAKPHLLTEPANKNHFLTELPSIKVSS